MKTSIRILFACFITICFTSNLFSIVKTSQSSGNWGAITWSPAGVPLTTDHIVIAAGTTVTLTGNTTCDNLTIQAGAKLDNGTFNLTMHFNSYIGNYYRIDGVHAGTTGNIILDFDGSKDLSVTGVGFISNRSSLKAMDPGNYGVVVFDVNCNLTMSCHIDFSGAYNNQYINKGKLHLTSGANFYPVTHGLFFNYYDARMILDSGSVYLDYTNDPSWVYNNGYFNLKNGNLEMGKLESGGAAQFVNYDTLIVGGSILGDNTGEESYVANDTVGAVIMVTGEIYPANKNGILICSGVASGANFNFGGLYSINPNYVIYNGNSTQGIKCPGYHDTSYGTNDSSYSVLIVTNAGTKNLQSSINIDDSLIISGGARLSTVSTYSIVMKNQASWRDVSTDVDPFIENFSTVSFVQTGMQSISYSGGGTGETFYNLAINKSNADEMVNMFGSVMVGNSLKLVNGGLALNSNTLTITNPLTSGIIRTHGFIKSETVALTGYGFVDWKINGNTGIYQYPFGKSGSSVDYIPVTLNITSAGGASGSIAIATYSTAVTNIPYPTGVLDTKRNGRENSTNVVDRFWQINTSYTTNPTITFTLTATTAEVGGLINLQAQRWNSSTLVWEAPLPGQSNTLNSATVPGVTSFSPWTLATNDRLLGPPIPISPNTTVCYGFTTLLSTSGGVSYNWQPAGSLNIATSSSVLASPTTTTTYSMVITRDIGLDTIYTTVSVPEPIQTIILTPNASICSGESYAMLSKTTISTPAYYSWTPTTSLNNTTVFNPIASPQITTTYTLTITDGWGCYNTANQLIHVEIQPTLIVSAPITICNGSSTQLSATLFGGTLLWSTNTTTNNIEVNPSTTTTYAAFGNNNYCQAKELIKVTVIDLPTVSAGNDQLMCIGSITGAILSGSSSSGTPEWTPPTYLSNSSNNTTNANPTSIGVYHYTLTVTEPHGCSNYDAVKVTVDTVLIVNTGNDLTICSGIVTTLNATITTGSTIVWNPTTSLTLNSLTPNSATLNSATQQLINYTITVSAPGCNDATDHITIQVLQSPQLLSSDVSICIGTTPTLTVSGADSYLWSDNTTTSSLTPSLSLSTQYTVLGTNNNGCTDTTTVQITVHALPNVDAGSNITASTSLKLNLQGSGASVYLWNPTVNLNQNDIPNPEIKTRTTQQYNLIGTDNNGCVNTDSVYIKYIVCDELFVPDAFSPNNDQQNDQLEIIVEDSQCIQTLNFQIYDRWGTKVFETIDPTVKWDGKYLGKELTDAVFVYRIDITNVDNKDITQKGNVSLVR